jgi:hypothetical protein
MAGNFANATPSCLKARITVASTCTQLGAAVAPTSAGNAHGKGLQFGFTVIRRSAASMITLDVFDLFTVVLVVMVSQLHDD